MRNITAIARFSGYSRMQVHRLVKTGQFRPGTDTAYRWALGARKRTGMGRNLETQVVKLWAESYVPHLALASRASRKRSGLHFNTAKYRAAIGTKKYAWAQLQFEGRMYDAERDKSFQARSELLTELGEVLQRAVSAAESGPPGRPKSLSEKFAPSIALHPIWQKVLVRERNLEKGCERFSPKRISPAQIQALFRRLSETSARKITLKALAAKIGVHASTLWRWKKRYLRDVTLEPSVGSAPPTFHRDGDAEI